MDAEAAWRLSFGEGVGSIRLGIKLPDFINTLVADKWPRAKINVITPSPESLFEVGTAVDLVDFGIMCHFQPKSERLVLIDCYSLHKGVQYNLKGTLLGGGSSAHIPTVEMIHKALGPSFPVKSVSFTNTNGEPASSATTVHLLPLNGISFMFNPVGASSSTSSSSLSHMYVHPVDFDIERPQDYEDLSVPATLPLLLGGGRGEALITAHQALQYATAANSNAYWINLQKPTSDDGGVAKSHLILPGYCNPSSGPETVTNAISSSARELQSCAALRLGMSPQDVISMLDSPHLVTHIDSYRGSGSGSSAVATGIAAAGVKNTPAVPTFTGCYSWKYYHCGLELYFNSVTHRLFRIVCKNNIAMHQEFGLFHRCPFYIFHEMDATRPTEGDASRDDEHPVNGSGGGKKKKGNKSTGEVSADKVVTASSLPETAMTAADSSDNNTVSFHSSWEHAYALMARWFNTSGDGGIADRGSKAPTHDAIHQEAAIQLPPDRSPYLPTKLFAYPEINAIFEVLTLPAEGGQSQSSWIASVSLCEPGYM